MSVHMHIHKEKERQQIRGGGAGEAETKSKQLLSDPGSSPRLEFLKMATANIMSHIIFCHGQGEWVATARLSHQLYKV